MAYVPQKFNPSHSLPLRVQDLLDLEKCSPALRQEIIQDTGIANYNNQKFSNFLVEAPTCTASTCFA